MGDMISLADRRRRTVERAKAVARVVEHLGELHDTVTRAGMGLISRACLRARATARRTSR